MCPANYSGDYDKSNGSIQQKNARFFLKKMQICQNYSSKYNVSQMTPRKALYSWINAYVNYKNDLESLVIAIYEEKFKSKKKSR